MADGEDVRDLIPDDPGIRLIHIEDGRTIGEKRNYGAIRAEGEIVAHFDDDDWSAPDRLDDQIGRLLLSGKSVTGYQHILFTNGDKWWKYHGMGNYAVGTSLCYRKEWWRSHQFPARQIGEDGEFVAFAVQDNQLSVADAGDLMVATVHNTNTSPRCITGDQWEELTGFPGIPGFKMA